MMNVAVSKAEAKGMASDVFTAVRELLPGSGEVAKARRQAFEAYERAGLPHRRLEDWKYTDLRALMREVLPLAAAPDANALKRAKAALSSLPRVDTCRLVLVDGVFVPSLSDLASLESGIRLQALREILVDSSNAARADLLDSGAIRSEERRV